MPDEPIMDVAHLGHLELLTPKPDASLAFLRRRARHDRERARTATSVYLRGWDDYERYSLKLTASHDLRRSAMPRFARAARRRWSGAWRR